MLFWSRTEEYSGAFTLLRSLFLKKTALTWLNRPQLSRTHRYICVSLNLSEEQDRASKEHGDDERLNKVLVNN